MTANPYAIESIEVIPVRLPLREPFVISYATYPDILSVLVRLRTAEGVTGWGEATPDPNVTGETWEGVPETLRHYLAPSLIGFDIRDREAMHTELERRITGAPAAKAALDIALHDALGHLMGQPVYALLGGRTKPFLTISRVVSMKSPDEMARDAQRHLADGFKTVKVKVGDPDNPHLDVERILSVREAIGPQTGLKIDVNQGWHRPGIAIRAIREVRAANPDYVEQPVVWWDLEGLADVRRATGVPIMVDEGCHNARDMLKIGQIRAADLVNIKLMKCGGLLPAVTLNAIAETTGVTAQVGTMVESSIASSAGLHLAIALTNVQTVEMGGPLMVSDEVGNARSWYDRDRITLPDRPGLGVDVDEDAVRRFATKWWTVNRS